MNTTSTQLYLRLLGYAKPYWRTFNATGGLGKRVRMLDTPGEIDSGKTVMGRARMTLKVRAREPVIPRG